MTSLMEPQNQCVYSYTVPGHTARANVLTFSISPYLTAVVDGDVRYLTFTERMLAFLRGCGPLIYQHSLKYVQSCFLNSRISTPITSNSANSPKPRQFGFFFSRKTRLRKSHSYLDAIVFEKLRFENVSLYTKTKSRHSQILVV